MNDVGICARWEQKSSGDGLCIPRSVPKYMTGHGLLLKPMEAALRRVVVSSNSTQ